MYPQVVFNERQSTLARVTFHCTQVGIRFESSPSIVAITVYLGTATRPNEIRGYGCLDFADVISLRDSGVEDGCDFPVARVLN